jgi:hypothetical protein
MNEPRPDRVRRYFDALVGPNGHLIEFGRRAFLDRRTVTPATPDDEAMLAGFDLVRRYVGTLQTAFDDYTTRQPQTFPAFTLRLQRARTMLSVIAEGNDNFMSAMDSVGFTDAERRSQSARFTLLQPDPQVASNLRLPDITVADFTDEVDQLSTVDGQAYLADSGQYGLDLVTDQADRLFRLLAPVLANVKAGGIANLNSLPTVAQVLTHERVSWALDDLIQQFSSLADLAA